MAAGHMAAVRLESDCLFSEVDFEIDLERVRSEVYPQVLARDSGELSLSQRELKE